MIHHSAFDLFQSFAVYDSDGMLKWLVTVLCKMRYILWVVLLLGACDVIQKGGQDGRHLRFYLKLEIIKKRRKLKPFSSRLGRTWHKKKFADTFFTEKSWKTCHFIKNVAYNIITRHNSNRFFSILKQIALSLTGLHKLKF